MCVCVCVIAFINQIKRWLIISKCNILHIIFEFINGRWKSMSGLNGIITYGNNNKKNTEPFYHFRLNAQIIIFEHTIMK